jgi:hypothetical protein
MLFKIVGSWFRGLFLMAFGAGWLGMAYYLSGFGAISPTATVLGLMLIGTLTFGSGLVIFVRGMMFAAQRAPLPKQAVGWGEEDEAGTADSGFDPDAAIARYLARRPEGGVAAAPATVPEAPARPAFGRKQA